jgi:hypothetical protein
MNDCEGRGEISGMFGFLALDNGDKEIQAFEELEIWYYSWFIV